MTPASHARRSVDSPFGPLLIAASRRGLIEVRLPGSKQTPTQPVEEDPADPEAASIADAAALQLAEYFVGTRHEFDLPLDLTGAGFRTRAWQAIAAIPYGETISYAEVAARAGAPGAYRAAGAACGANPLAIVVPCHRVAAADGSLHGYGGGLAMKRLLLEREGVRFAGERVRHSGLVTA